MVIVMIIRENILKKIRPFYDNELIKVLIGLRRSGKSVILQQIMDELMENGVQASQIIYMNFEDFQYSSITNAEQLYRYICDKRKNEKKYYMFFDEIQMVDEFERAVNSFRATWDVSIFITGSNAKLLSGELATLLSGRYVSFRVTPFSFVEYCEIKRIANPTDENLIEYMNWGGMPQRFSMGSENETRTFLQDLYNSIVLRDIVQRTGAKEVDLINRIMEYIMLNPSQTFSAKGILNYFKSVERSVSAQTLYNYLDHIQTSLIVSKAQRYDIRGKQLLTTLDKYFLTDLGLGRIHNSGYKLEMGAMLENVVYNELKNRDYEVYVGKIPGGEVDFVAVKGERREYYQVAYSLVEQSVIDREFGAFKAIADNYPKYVISMDKFDFSRDGIIHKNVIKFLTETMSF
ncbi:MAG: ATP-binding protein [Bacillus sp. (in: Bacteria)]|nr:ATP-binding protein [Bacillus sp. (in: firmicutes)]MCM1427383.1 ATP-binding protein [Eubacterium sp.]